MKRINSKSVTEPLSGMEMKLVTGGHGDPRVKIWCITGEETEVYMGEFNACYFHLCNPMDGVRCIDVL